MKRGGAALSLYKELQALQIVFAPRVVLCLCWTRSLAISWLGEWYIFTHCREMAHGRCTWRSNGILLGIFVPLLYGLSVGGPVCSSALGEGECVQTQQPSGSNCAAENVSRPLHVGLHPIDYATCSSAMLQKS